jgi:hypothetical protein
MPITRTFKAALQKPATTDRNWDVPLNANADALDGNAPLSALLVTQAEYPSSSLNVKVASGSFINQAGAFIAYAGTASFAVTPSVTTLLRLTDTASLAGGTAWPAGAHVRLAAIVANASTIISISDTRTPFRSATS